MLVRTGHGMYHFEVSRTALYRVRSTVRTGSYQYIPSCTALYQVYRIPDHGGLAQRRAKVGNPL
jgi:hypothetical protein